MTSGGPEPVNAADLEALSDRLDTLNRHMAILIKDKVEAEVAEVSVPRAEVLHRLRRNFWTILAITALAIMTAVLINRITLQQAQHDLNNQVVGCFLRPGDNTPAEAAACAERFGNGYGETQRRSAEATRNFVDLQRWARAEGWTPPKP